MAERAAVRTVWWGVALVVIAGFALIAATLYRASDVAPEVGRADATRVHAAAVIAAANDLERAVENAERAQRAFLLTANAAYFDAYRRGAERAASSLARLRGLTAGAPRQQRRVALLGHEVTLQLARLARTVRLRREAGPEAAREVLSKQAGFDPVEIIVGIVANLTGAETAARSEAEARLAEARLRRADANRLVGGAVAAVMLFGSGLATLGFRRHRRAQREARRNDERYRLLVEDVADVAIATLDTNGRITGWNRGAERITGYGQAEMMGRDLADAYPAEPAAAGLPARHLSEAARAGRAAFEGWRACADGSQFWADTVMTALHDEGGRLRGFTDITRDATDRRRRAAAEACRRDRQARAQHRAVLGRFAAGVANECEAVLATAERRREGAGAVAELRAVAVQQELAPQDVDIARLIEDFADDRRRMPGPAIVLEGAASPKLWPAHVDPDRFAHALATLLQTVTAAGPVPIAAGNTYLDAADEADPGGPAPGRYVLVALGDRDGGPTAGPNATAFEPFSAPGRGFGLSGVYGFMRQSGGDVRFCHEPGQGGRIVLLLPAGGEATSSSLPISARSGETVLVAQADPQMRAFSAGSLVGLGYRPIEAAGAEAALRLLEHHREIVVVLADLGMCGLDPRRFTASARQRIHHVKLLLAGDCVARAGIDRRIFAPGVDLLAKPFTAEMLGHGLRRLLRAG